MGWPNDPLPGHLQPGNQQLRGGSGHQPDASLPDSSPSVAESVSRLNSLAPGLDATHSDLHDEKEASLAAFNTALLGSGYAMDSDHQMIHTGSDGLYSLCQQRLELRQRREALRGQIAQRVD